MFGWLAVVCHGRSRAKLIRFSFLEMRRSSAAPRRVAVPGTSHRRIAGSPQAPAEDSESVHRTMRRQPATAKSHDHRSAAGKRSITKDPRRLLKSPRVRCAQGPPFRDLHQPQRLGKRQFLGKPRCVAPHVALRTPERAPMRDRPMDGDRRGFFAWMQNSRRGRKPKPYCQS